LTEYINQNEKDIRDLVNDFDISIDNLASKVTNKAFGIKVKATPTGHSIENMWVLKDSLWPYNWDFNDREELRILVPESRHATLPTVSDKSINNKIGNVSQPIASCGQRPALPFTPPVKYVAHININDIVRVPPKGTCDSNKFVHADTNPTKDFICSCTKAYTSSAYNQQ
jgi:hypothetical protein